MSREGETGFCKNTISRGRNQCDDAEKRARTLAERAGAERLTAANRSDGALSVGRER